MRDLQDADVDRRVIGLEFGNKVLGSKSRERNWKSGSEAYIDKRIPSFPEITIRNYTNSFSQLRL
jgi:hypothetical protein